jgi:regulator of protease activity HflC (stomatin/prohibitin superfamily)
MTNTPNQPKMIRWIVFAFIGIIFFLMLTRTTFLTIDPGQSGVLFKRFAGGIDKDRIYDQGFHIVAPWNKMFIYDIRINERFEKMEVLSKNGLTIVVELSVRYRAQPDQIGELHNEIGPRFLESIILPEIRSATREVIGKYLPEELYSSKREAIQVEIFDRTYASVESKHIFIDAILIRGVTLPQTLQDAIERKLKQEQSALEYDFRLDSERKEAERKIIEAQAKSDANRILNASLTSNILRDKGIEATMKLAESPNSKVVIIGSGKDGLPLILGDQ